MYENKFMRAESYTLWEQGTMSLWGVEFTKPVGSIAKGECYPSLGFIIDLEQNKAILHCCSDNDGKVLVKSVEIDLF